MPLPLGHAAIGFATHEISKGKTNNEPWWKVFLFVVILSNLPDIDVLAGLLVKGNGWFYHRGLTHSIAFALLGGVLASQCWRISSHIPKMGFTTGFFVTFSHVMADILNGEPLASLLWPFEIARVGGHIGWAETVGSIFFNAHQDAGLIFGSFMVFYFTRWARRRMRKPVFSHKARAAKAIAGS